MLKYFFDGYEPAIQIEDIVAYCLDNLFTGDLSRIKKNLNALLNKGGIGFESAVITSWDKYVFEDFNISEKFHGVAFVDTHYSNIEEYSYVILSDEKTLRYLAMCVEAKIWKGDFTLGEAKVISEEFNIPYKP